jgi:hypothetical protein
MGRHVNDDAAAHSDAIEPGSTDPDGTDPDGAESTHETARHAAPGSHAADGLLEDDAVISPDTHVGVDFDQLAPGTPDAAPSPANPDALTEHGLVGDGHEME